MTPKQRKRWVLFLILSFLLINLACHLSAGNNADSRFATLIAMVEDHSFKIDPYVDLTTDWARTPDGHYYSNKAPGPMLIAAPLFWGLEKSWLGHHENKEERIRLLIQHKASWLKLFSYLFQLLPFLFLTWMIANKLIQENKSDFAIFMTLATLLFGNTASLFMSTYYGHAMTAVFILATLLALESSRFFCLGLFLGFTILCDYSGALLIIPLLLILKPSAKTYLKIFLGGIFPLALWSWYHSRCFGSPFAIANQFQNPLYQDVKSEAHNLWGILLPVPQLSTLYQLFFVTSRGILWVAPWILVILGWVGVKTAQGKTSEVPAPLKFATWGFGLLLWVNSCFGGWHGGLTPGPRYLSPTFPALALGLGLVIDSLKPPTQKILFLSVIFSLVFTALVYSTHISPPETPLWPLYLKLNFMTPSISTISRLFLIVPLLTTLVIKTLKWPR